MKAMIFAAGLGKRLGKLTESIPKALVDINGKTVLQIAVEKCSASGFADIIINVHHLPALVKNEIDRLNRIGYSITVSDESDLLLDTGGGLFKARSFFDDKPFLLYNADIISDINLNSLFDFHMLKNGIATLAVRKREGSRFLLIDNEGRLRGWTNKATGEKILTGPESENLTEIGFSGIHIVNPGIFSLMDEGIYSLTSLYLNIAAENKIFTFRDDSGFWADIGTQENLEMVRRHFMHLEP